MRKPMIRRFKRMGGRIGATLLASSFVLMQPLTSDAARYDRTELGATIATYSEHRMGLNASEDTLHSFDGRLTDTRIFH